MTQHTPPIAVTGATGKVGGRVARLLSEAGVAQRLVVRDAGRAPSVAAGDVATATYGDPHAARAALGGIETLFMVSGSEAADRVDQHETFVDAASAVGVRHGRPPSPWPGTIGRPSSTSGRPG